MLLNLSAANKKTFKKIAALIGEQEGKTLHVQTYPVRFLKEKIVEERYA